MQQFVNKYPWKFKKIIPLLLTLVFLLVPIQANAAILTEEDIDALEKPGILEKQFSKFVLNVSNSLIGITGAQDVSVLVFQRPEVVNTDTWISNTSSSNRSDLVFGIFPEGAFNGIAEVYDSLVKLLPIPMVIILALAGLFLLFDVLRSTDNRSQMKEYLLGLVGAILLLRFGYLVWDWIIFINYAFLVDPIYFMLQDNGIQITSFISTIWDPGSTEKIFSATNFMVALMVGCAAFMTFSVNYQYMLRILILGVLIVLFPVAVFCTIIPSRRNVLNQWFMMFTSQVFLQGAHAITLGLFFLMLASSTGYEFWLCLVMFFGLPMMSDLIQRIIGSAFGDSNSSGGIGKSFSNASGMSSMLGMVALGKSMMKSKGTSSSETSSKTPPTTNKGNGQLAFAGMQNAGGMTNSNNNNNEKGLASSSGINQSKLGPPQQNVRNGMFRNTSTPNINDNSNRSFSNEFEDSNANSANNNAPVSDGSMGDGSMGYASPSSNSNESLIKPIPAAGKAPSAVQSGNHMSRAGRKISNISRKIAGSDGVKRTAKLATMGGLIVGGAAVGTMITGNSRNGALIGTTAGLVAGKGVEFGISKGTKLTEFGGEVLESKADGKQALDVTKGRIGYHDPSQLADRSEMGRMGRELIGGKTGEVLGRSAGKVNYAAGKYDVSPPPTNNYNARQNYNTVQERENLVTNTIPQSVQNVAQSKSRLDDAQENVALIKARAAAEPTNAKLKGHVQSAEQHRAKMQVIHETRKTNHDHLVNKAEQFYERQKLKRNFEDLGQSRKSSGKLS